MKRRDFIKNIGLITGAGTVSFALNGIGVKAFAKPFLNINSVNGKILVLIQLKGGNDGINTVIPLDQYSTYAAKRAQIKIEEQSVLKFNNSTGVHPNLASFKTLFDDGELSLIQNVGYASPNRSHFRATDIWLSASDSTQFLYDGWIGRYLQKAFPDFPTVPPKYPMAIQLSSVPSQIFESPQGGTAVAFSNPNDFYTMVQGLSVDNDPPPATIAGDELKFLKEIASLSIQYASIIKEKADKGNPLQTYPSNRLGPQLKIVADLIMGGLETPVYLTQVDGFDTHSNQLATHQTLFTNISDSVNAFQKDLEAAGLADKVVIMTFSEFGRRVQENASLGTDHGSAAPIFVIGKNVKGGIIGANANLSSLDSNGDIKFVYDYRQIYATLLKDHLGMSEVVVNEILLKSFQTLPIIKAATGVKDNFELPSEFVLNQNYPNPFNPTTTISYSLPEFSHVSLKVFDMLGKEVAELVNTNQHAGKHNVSFNGARLASGTYIYTIKANGFLQSRKMLLIK